METNIHCELVCFEHHILVVNKGGGSGGARPPISKSIGKLSRNFNKFSVNATKPRPCHAQHVGKFNALTHPKNIDFTTALIEAYKCAIHDLISLHFLPVNTSFQLLKLTVDMKQNHRVFSVPCSFSRFPRQHGDVLAVANTTFPYDHLIFSPNMNDPATEKMVQTDIIEAFCVEVMK